MSVPTNTRKLCRIFFIGIVLALISGIYLLDLVPPTSRDALIHHLAIPKLYLQHGGIYEIANLSFSYYPMNLDLLYMIPLAFGNDILPKYIHFAFALGTAWLLYRYLLNRINACYGILGALFFLSIPIIIKLSITAYVDLGLIFFSTSSLLLLFQWAENRHCKTLLLAGICCGLAVGTKYNGLLSLLILTAFVPLLSLHSQPETNRASLTGLGHGLFFLFFALLACSPWWIRNYHWTGNPLYPLFNTFFNPTSAQPASYNLGLFTIRRLAYHETPLQIFLLPVRIFFEGQDNVPQFFDGRLNPFLLFLPMLAFLPNVERKDQREFREKIFLVAFALLFFLFALFTTSLRIRYISPIVPPLVLLSIYGVRNINMLLYHRLSHNKLLPMGMILLVMAILFPNLQYLTRQFQHIRPLEYISSGLDREAYLRRHLPEYATMSYANHYLPPKAKLLCLYLAGRSYYLNRTATFEPRFNHSFLSLMKENSLTEARQYLQRENINYLLIRDNLLRHTLQNIQNDAEKNRWAAFFTNWIKPVYSANGYSLLVVVQPRNTTQNTIQ